MSIKNNVIVKNAKKPVVITLGVIIGFFLLAKRFSVSASATGTSDATLLAARQSDNELSAQQAVIAGQVEQTRINAENAKAIAAIGYNADVVTKGLAASTALAIAGETTKQVLGASQILATRDVTINQQNVNRDTTLGLDYNKKALELGLNRNATDIAIANLSRDVILSNNETSRFNSLQESNRVLINAQTSQFNTLVQAVNQPKQQKSGNTFGNILTGIGNAAGGIGSLVRAF